MFVQAIDAALERWAADVADGSLSEAAYIQQCENLLRPAAALGSTQYMAKLAMILHLRAHKLRTERTEQERAEGRVSPQRVEAVTAAEAECALLLNRAADAGCDAAGGLLYAWAPTISLASLDRARRLSRTPAPTPTTSNAPPAPVEEDDDVRVTLRERVRWWLRDTWWAVRYKLGDWKWAISEAWWTLSDRFSAWRAGQGRPS